MDGFCQSDFGWVARAPMLRATGGSRTEVSGTLPIIIKGDDQGMHVTRSSGSLDAMHHLINGMLPLIGNAFWSAGSFSSALYLRGQGR